MRSNPPDPLGYAAILSLVLALLKFGAFLVSGSVIVLSSFFDSLGDASISFVNRYASRLAKADPDTEHPYGHGGFEVASSLMQGFIISGFAIALGWESIRRLISPPPEVDPTGNLIAICVMLFSAGSAWFIQSMHAQSVEQLAEKGERSLSIQADRGHYMGDIWVNLSGAIGLIAIHFTGLSILDALLGIVGAGLLGKTAYPILLEAWNDLTARNAPEDLLNKIKESILSIDERILGIHRLRARYSGPTLFIDFHLKLPDELPLKEAHDLGEKVTQILRREFPQLDVNIHLDPASEPDDELW